MLFNVVAALSLLFATSGVFAQDNPITAPTAGQVINAGTNFEIEWTPSANGTISLDLGTGSSADINVVMNLATGIPNTGSFQWSVADSIPAGTDYTVKISSGSTDVNFSARFTIVSSVTNTSSTSSTSTTSSSSSSTSSGTTTSAESSSTTESGSASASASASGKSGSASAASTTTSESSITASTAHAGTAAPPSISSMATKIPDFSFATIFVVIAAIAAGMMAV